MIEELFTFTIWQLFVIVFVYCAACYCFGFFSTIGAKLARDFLGNK